MNITWKRKKTQRPMRPKRLSQFENTNKWKVKPWKRKGLTLAQFTDLYAYVSDPKNGWTKL